MLLDYSAHAIESIKGLTVPAGFPSLQGQSTSALYVHMDRYWNIGQMHGKMLSTPTEDMYKANAEQPSRGHVQGQTLSTPAEDLYKGNTELIDDMYKGKYWDLGKIIGENNRVKD